MAQGMEAKKSHTEAEVEPLGNACGVREELPCLEGSELLG